MPVEGDGDRATASSDVDHLDVMVSGPSVAAYRVANEAAFATKSATVAAPPVSAAVKSQPSNGADEPRPANSK